MLLPDPGQHDVRAGDTFGTAGHWGVRRGTIPHPQRGLVGILGAGPIGMSVFHVLRTRKTGPVIITDKIEDRLKKAGALR